jgi:hypothetical protein
MRTCEECGSTNLSVKVPVEQFYSQEPDGRWTDGGTEWADERAVWYCDDCECQWEGWFEEHIDQEGES